MARRRRRAVPAGLLAASLAAASLLLATPTGDPPAAAADDCDGVWVVVDATALGGEVTTRCAPGDPADGFEALTGAGFSYGFVPNRPGFVCTIGGHPDPCNGAPTDAHWSYWHAPAGGSWSYSQRGAGSRDPAPGTVDGWSFGDGSSPPGEAPPAPAPDPEPEPEPRPDPEPESSTSPSTPRGADDDADPDDAARSGGGDRDGDGGGDADGDGRAGDEDADADATDDGDSEAAPGTMQVPPEARRTGDLRSPPAARLPSPEDDVDGEESGAAADPVALDAGGGRTGPGPLAGGALVAGLAAAAVVRSRRRQGA